MVLPLGYHSEGEKLSNNAVFCLHKSLYGLKQASRQWYLKFSQALVEEGYRHSASDHSLFVKSNGDIFTTILVYVDDIIITSNDKCAIDRLKVSLNKRFKFKDLGDLKFFPGLEIARSAKGICVLQREYIL